MSVPLVYSNTNTPFTFNLWEFAEVNFDEMISDIGPTGCGGYTYELIYEDGPLLGTGIDHTSTYTLTNNPDLTNDEKLSGEPLTQDWLDSLFVEGTHTFSLNCTNGMADYSANARGIDGLFHSVMSDQFQITIINPCVYSIVNHDQVYWGASPPELTVPVGDTVLTSSTYSGPKDWMSTVFGNGYDRCLHRVYTIVNDSY